MTNTIPDHGLLFVGPGAYDALKPSYDFIPGLLHDSTVVMLYGPPGCGKTFLAIHLLCSAALGRTVFGVTPDTRRGLYVGLEGESGIKARIAAWCAANGQEEQPIHYALGRFSFASDDGQDLEALIEKMKAERIGFLVLDTLSLAMAGLDEISGQHVSHVMEALHRIKRETGACVVAIAHTGKNEKAGIRGHSAQLGNADTTIEVMVNNRETVREGNKTFIIEHTVTLDTPRCAIVRKQRDGEGGRQFHFTLALQDTPFRDARGNVLQRPAISEAEAFQDLGPDTDDCVPARPSGVDAIALKTLSRLQARCRLLDMPMTRPMLRSALQKAGWKSSSKSVDAWGRAFSRLMERLTTAGLWETAS